MRKPQNSLVSHVCVKSPTGGHYWVCDPQGGPLSVANCKYCDARTVFSNAFNDGQETAISRHHGYPTLPART